MINHPILKPDKEIFNINTVGIIPVAGSYFKNGLHFPAHPCLLPIGRHLNLLEHAALECLGAGCSSIWVVCTNPVEPLLRACLGEYFEVKDKSEKKSKFPIKIRKHIYYVPLNSSDVEKRICSVGWSILYGATIVDYLSKTISRRASPARYYVSFPLAVHSISRAKALKKAFSKTTLRNKNIIFCSKYYKNTLNEKNVSILDNAPINFSFCGEILPLLQQNYEKQEISGNKIYSLKDIFSPLDETNTVKQQASFYYYVSSWKSYINYCRSSASRWIGKINFHPNLLGERGYKVVGENSYEEDLYIENEDEDGVGQ